MKLTADEKLLAKGTAPSVKEAFQRLSSAIIDWRSDDQEMLGAFAAFLPKGYLTLSASGPRATPVVEVSSKHARARVRLESFPTLTLAAATAAVLEPEFEAHLFAISLDSDTHVYLVRPKSWWDAFRAEHKKAYLAAFAPKTKLPSRYELLAGPPPVDPRKKVPFLPVEHTPLGKAGTLSHVRYATGELLFLTRGKEALAVDLTKWPPKSTVVAGVFSAACPDGGKGLFLLTEGRSLHHLRAGRTSVRAKKVPQAQRAATLALLGGNVILWEPDYGGEDGPTIESKPGSFVSLREELGVPEESYGGVLHGVAQLASGRQVLVWGDGGFEHVKGKWTRTFALPASSRTMDAYGKPNELPPYGENGFWFAAEDRLWRVARGKKAESVPLAGVEVAQVMAGPPGELWLRASRKVTRAEETRDLGVLYSPKKGTYSPLPGALIGPADRPQGWQHWVWSHATGRLAHVEKNELLSISLEVVETLPRFDGKTGRPA